MKEKKDARNKKIQDARSKRQDARCKKKIRNTRRLRFMNVGWTGEKKMGKA